MAKKNLNVSIDEAIYERFRENCKKKGFTITDIIEFLMLNFCEKEDAK